MKNQEERPKTLNSLDQFIAQLYISAFFKHAFTVPEANDILEAYDLPNIPNIDIDSLISHLTGDGPRPTKIISNMSSPLSVVLYLEHLDNQDIFSDSFSAYDYADRMGYLDAEDDDITDDEPIPHIEEEDDEPKTRNVLLEYDCLVGVIQRKHLIQVETDMDDEEVLHHSTTMILENLLKRGFIANNIQVKLVPLYKLYASDIKDKVG